MLISFKAGMIAECGGMVRDGFLFGGSDSEVWCTCQTPGYDSKCFMITIANGGIVGYELLVRNKPHLGISISRYGVPHRWDIHEH